MKKLLALVVAIIMACGMVAAIAEDYPTKGLTAINPWSAGGGTDSCLRAFTAALEKQLGVAADKRKIDIGDPIRETGVREISVWLYSGITTKMKLDVQPLAK